MKILWRTIVSNYFYSFINSMLSRTTRTIAAKAKTSFPAQVALRSFRCVSADRLKSGLFWNFFFLSYHAHAVLFILIRVVPIIHIELTKDVLSQYIFFRF